MCCQESTRLKDKMTDGDMRKMIRQFRSPPPCPSCLGVHMGSRGWQRWPWRPRRSCRHWSWSAAPSGCRWSPRSHSARCRRLLLEHSRLFPRCQDREVTRQTALKALVFTHGAGRRHGTALRTVFTLGKQCLIVKTTGPSQMTHVT